jgi:hypothetical protein
MTPLERISSKFEVNKNGMARCPAHDDRTPSLSVTEGGDGRVLLKCQAGCDTKDVLAARGLTMADLFPHEKANSSSLPATQVDYVYRDENGRPYNRVRRLPGKQFRQDRWDGGTWVPGLGDHRPIPYRLDELAALKPGADVYVVEGEKDADTLTRLGLVATTAPMGASTWGKVADLAEKYLAGMNVYVVGDNDPPGWRHMLDVYASLQALAATISLRLAPEGKGKDVSEMIGTHGLTTGDLLEIEADDLEARVAGGDEPAPWESDPLNLLDWTELFNPNADDEDRWLLEPLIARGRGHSFFAGAKTGKSELMLAVAVRLATGRTFDGATDPIDVLYLDFEMAAADVRDRLDALGVGPEDLAHLHYAHLPSLPPLDTDEGGRQLVDRATELGVGHVFIDTIGRAVGGKENDNDTIQDFYRHTGGPLKARGVGWSRLAHAGKDDAKGQRGGSAANDDVDIVVKIERTDNGTRLKTTHQRMGWFPDETNLLREELNNGTLRWSLRDGPSWPAGTKECAADLDRLGAPTDITQRAAAKLLSEAKKGRRTNVVSAAIKYRKNTFDPAGITPGITPAGTPRNHDGNHAETSSESPATTEGITTGIARNQHVSPGGNRFLPLGGNHSRDPGSAEGDRLSCSRLGCDLPRGSFARDGLCVECASAGAATPTTESPI